MVGSIYKHKAQSKLRRKRALRLLKLIFLLLITWLIGFLWFVGFKPTVSDLNSHKQVDGIVALTGGGGRIEAGINALNLGLGQRLLISGVNASLNTTTILNAFDSNLHDCQTQDDQNCITLGRQALDTKGNAIETKAWAEENAFNNIMVITSEYHMRRALLELEEVAPELTVQPFVIKSQLKWLSIALEYTKYLYSLARHAFS